MNRTYWHCKNLDRGYNKLGDIRGPFEEDLGNLVGSKVFGNFTHAPVLDIDFEAQLIPSTTPGHYHLYLDKEMSWWRYKRLLKQLYKSGIIEYGYYKGSIEAKQTLVRKPTVKKPEELVKSNMKPLHHIRLKEITDMMMGLVRDADPNPPKSKSKYSP